MGPSQDQLREKLSEVLGAIPIFPPLQKENAPKLFDIVQIKSRGNPHELLIPTHTNLTDVLSQDEKEQLEDDVEYREASEEARTFSAHTSYFASASADVSVEIVSGNIGISHDSKHDVTLSLHNEESTFLRSSWPAVIQKYVHKYWARLASKTSFQNVIHKRFMVGVITKVITGELQANANAQRGTSLEGGASVEGLPGGNVNARVEYSTGESFGGPGVLGVDMMCVAVQCEPKTCIYRLSYPISVVHDPGHDFSRARTFVRGGLVRNLLLITRTNRKRLFIANYITKQDDRYLDDESREKYIQYTKYGNRSQHLSTPSSDDESKPDSVPLMTEFGGIDGEALWNDISTSDGEDARKPLLIVTHLDELDDASAHEDLQWLPNGISVPTSEDKVDQE